ncbi:hypothetical protein [Maribacter sp. IgM3_T14_3]|uniref:hypothetical protein n=1 Tax=Maribacter sp. IgM3_T14_3 TaxID=3415140 RepID=UPI003C7045A3
MEGRERAELKNRILEFLLADPHHSFTVDNLWKQLDKPAKNLLNFKAITDEMLDTGSRYFLYIKNDPFSSFGKNELTQDFLNDGGFIPAYEKGAELLKINDAKRLRLEDDSHNQYTINKWKAKMAPWQYYTFWPLFVIAILSTAFSLYKSFNSNDQKMESVEKDIQYLKEIIQTQRLS